MIKQRLVFLQNNSKPIEVTLDQLNEVSIIDTVIIIKKNNNYTVFSARCSHLGCIINKTENNEFICPCHGSRYSLNGEVLKGPADKKLTALNFKIDDKNGKILIETSV
ncbi:ubiquinol-cytochrome c reductase iron-sulfur subunit [Calditrichota bacterium]